MKNPQCVDFADSIMLENEKARYILDDILCGHFECPNPDAPSPLQMKMIRLQYKRIWIKLMILNDILARIDAVTAPFIQD